MSANEEYLDSLLKSMGREEVQEPKEEKDASMMSLEEIEAMFAEAEKAAAGNDKEPEGEEPKLPEGIEEPKLPEEAKVTDETGDEELKVPETMDETEQPEGPEVTEEPERTEEPETVEEPEQTEEPETVEELEQTEEPEVVEEPEQTEEPETVEELEQTEEPEVVEEPEQPEEPEAVNEPEQTQEPEAKEEAEDDKLKFPEVFAETEPIEESGVTEEPKGGEPKQPEEPDIHLSHVPEEDSEDILSLLDKQNFDPEPLDMHTGSLQDAAGQAEYEETPPGQTPPAEYTDLFADDIPVFSEEGAPEETKEKKEGKFKKFFSGLFAKMTEEEEPQDGLSEENRTVLEELEAEDKAAAGKKKKRKKGKMPAGAQTEEDGEGKQDAKGKKAVKEKKKKTPKEKKKPVAEKAPEEIEPDEKPSRRISKKSIAVVILFAMTVFAIVFFGGNLFSQILQKNNAKKAFEKQDYLTCYESLYGMKLSEKEKEMYAHAEAVLRIERRISVYEGYLKEGRDLEALDSLMRAVAGYESLYTAARECGAAAEVSARYEEILNILKDKYGVSETDARAIVNCQSDVDYTRYLTALTEGRSVSGGAGGELTLPPEELEDMLPPETEMDPQNNAGN